MNPTETVEIANVVQRVQSWPPPMRIALARQILETLECPPAAPSKLPRGPSGNVLVLDPDVSPGEWAFLVLV